MSNATIAGHSGPVPPTTHRREPGAASIRQAGHVAGIGILAMAALFGFGIFYVFDSLVSTVLASPPGSVATVTFLGEFLLALWLVARGRRISLEEEGHGL
jgi:hypothetical protein